MFENWLSTLAYEEAKLLNKLGITELAAKALVKVHQSKSIQASNKLSSWLKSQGKDNALKNVDKWADLLIDFMVTVNVPKLTEKSREDLESPGFKEWLIEYIKSHPTFCYSVYTMAEIPKEGVKEFNRLIDLWGKKLGLPQKEIEVVKEGGMKGKHVSISSGTMSISGGVIAVVSISVAAVAVSIALIYFAHSGPVAKISDKISEIPWWVWAILIIGIGITGVGIGWSKIRPKGKKYLE